jgi:PAS domain S-box-containing protein
LDRESRTSWLFLLDWGVVALTLVSAGASALAALIAFKQQATSAMAEALLACGAAATAAWLGRSASRAAKRWQEELVAWHGNDIVILADDTGRILDANDRAAEAYGLPLDGLFHRHVRTLRHESAADGFEAHLAELRECGRAIFETVHRHGDGSPFPVEVSARVVTMRGRRLLHLIARDVTEAHRARARLVAAERLTAVGTLAAGMAHDVNNPLCAVIGNVTFAQEALRDESPDLLEVRQALGDAHSSAVRVRDLVRDLSAFSNAFTAADGDSDLATVVSDAIAASRVTTDPRLSVVVSVPELPRVGLASRRLSQVLVSLLRHAADGMPEGDAARREIRIEARRSDPSRLAVEVADDGPALPAGGIVSPIPQLDGQPRTTRGGGAGLAAVIGMVRAVGGDVVAESGGERGTVVRVLLPLAGAAR